MSMQRLHGTTPPSLATHAGEPESKMELTKSHSERSDDGNTAKVDGPVRVLFLGSAKVGKTSIIRRFLYNAFDPNYTPTVEDTHSQKYIVHDNVVPLLVIDTAGSYYFPAMLRLCIAQANAFVIVFSHDNAASLEQAGHLLNLIKSQRLDNNSIPSMTACSAHEPNDEVHTPPPITVVCNKSDLPPSDSQVSVSATMDWLTSNGLKPSQFVYASAKTNDSIMAIFKSLWDQNELSKAVLFERWSGTHPTSSSSTHAQTPPPTPNITDFSAISEPMTQGHSVNHADTTKISSEMLAHKVKSSIIRNSVRLRRRLSSKSSKAKPDGMQLECVIS
ncbi:unnamed protein product [Dicrocoelium dendriticum]|nr:unnamed protein product [Dicrocoelium dendriticum]